MNKPQRYVKNAKLFNLAIENFDEEINEDNIERSLGTVAGYEWHAELEADWEDGVDYLSVKLAALEPNTNFFFRFEVFSVEVAICVKNERLDRWVKCQRRFEVKRSEWIGWEKFMRMDTILDPNVGFLTDDGSLVIQIEIRTDIITDWNGNRMLNFLDPFEGNVVLHNFSSNLYTSKQMLMFYSPVLAEQLADGRDKVIRRLVFVSAAHIFLQLIHGVKIDYSTFYTLDVLYLAHKYQVLTVLRHFEIEVRRYSEKEIHEVFISSASKWVRTLIGEHYHEDFLRMRKVRDEPLSEEYKELNIRKREMLLAITRASPFPRKLDSGSSNNNNNNNSETDTPPASSFSILRFFSKTLKSISCC